MRILIVDSHMEAGEIYKTLEKYCAVETVDEGKVALKFLRHKEVDIVIIRYMLSDMTGSQLAAVIKQKIPHLAVFVAVQNPGMDIWQEITAAKALVLPLPVDINRIKKIYSEKNILIKDRYKKEILSQEVKTEHLAEKDGKIANEESLKNQESPKENPQLFIPVQQGNKKRSKLKQNEHRCQIITIFSPKGGVGKTTTVVNLAALIKTELNMRTAILEFTRQTGNVLGHFNLNPSIDVSHWISREEWPAEDELEDMLLWCPNTEIAILPTQRLFDEDVKKTKILPEHVIGILKTLQPHFDFLVIDGGTIIDDVLFQLMALSDYIGMVSILNLETLQDCHYVPMMMERRGIDKGKLINILNKVKNHVGMSAKDAFAIVGTDNNHVIHYDKEVEKVPKEKEPFIVRKNNKGKYYKEIKELVVKLDQSKFQENKGLLKKLKFWNKEWE